MAIKIYNESSLSSSEIFKGINNSSNPGITQQAIEIIKTEKKLDMNDLEAAYISLKQITDTLTRAALKAFDREDVIMVYEEGNKHVMTKAVPFITFNTKGKYKTYIFTHSYITKNKDGVMSIQAPVMRDLLTGATIANSLKSNYNILLGNVYLQKILSEIYSKLFMRILNRDYAIAADKNVYESSIYYINRFFLSNIYGITDINTIENIAASHFKYIDDLKYNDIKNTYDANMPINVSDLLNLLTQLTPRMKNLTLGRFLSSWINYYYLPAMLAVDNIEYLIFMILSLLNGNNIISIAASDIAKEAKNIKSFRSELIKIIK